MRPSVLPTIALALILVGAGAFGAWFVLSQEDIAPPPIAATHDGADRPDKSAGPVDGAVISPAEAAKPDTPVVNAGEPKLTDVEAHTRPDGINANKGSGASQPDEAGRLTNAADKRKAEAAAEKKAEEISLDDILAPEDILGNGEKEPFSATISGTVADNHGQPVPGASVYCDFSEIREMTSKGGARVAFATATSRDDSPKGTPVATTDGSGNFTAQIKREVGKNTRVNVSLTAKAAGLAVSKPQSFGLKNGETRDNVKLGLRGAGTVSGRVVDQSGRGVDGATVSITEGGTATYSGGAGIDLPVSMGGGGKESAVTDSAGNFRIEGVAEGRYRPTVRATGWRQVSGPVEVTVVSGEDTTLAPNFEMAAATAAKIKLLNEAGQPVAGYCTVFFKDGATTAKTMGGICGADGVLSLNDVPAGTFSVEVRIFGRKPLTLNGTFTDGQTTDLGSHTLDKADPKESSGGFGSGTIIIPGEG